MDIQRRYDDDLFISMQLNNCGDENFALELQIQEAMLSSLRINEKLEMCEICGETKKMFPFEECSHGYCRECISKHIKVQLEKPTTLITCPALRCATLLDIATCGEIVPADVRRTWEEVLRVEREKDIGHEEEERGREDLMLVELAKVNKWQRCPNCKFYVEKMEGCLHMTCRCQFQFCYACGERWSSIHGGCQ